MDYESLAKKYGTPFFIYDFDEIKKRYLLLKEAFAGRKNQIFYALKANCNLALLRFLVSLDSGFDCVSANEIKKALMAGAKPYKIIFSGVGKKKEELSFALKAKILFINIESEAELKLLEEVAKELDKIANISIRVNPDVDAKTHPYISTGLRENKFGVSLEEAKSLYLYAKKSPFLNTVGIHFHIGSQILDISSIIEASFMVAKLARELKSAGVELRFFDVGGGLGVRYKDEKEPNLYEYAQGILNSLQAQNLCICLEPGRFIMANSGVLVSSVIYEKFNEGKRFVIIDAAMNDLARPALYGAFHEISPLSASKESLCDVVGGICESGDFLAKDILLPACKYGDLLLIKSAGAYAFSMSSNYNSRNKACELAYKEGKIYQIRKRQSLEDQLINEINMDI